MALCRPAVFFDRDGVLNIDHGYTYRQQDFEWMPGAQDAIKYFNDHNYLVFVITNQSGIARGYYTEEDMHALHEFMNKELGAHDAHIDAFYHCPHYPDAQEERYRTTCTCRKPAPGMIEQAFNEWDIKKEQSFLIGDKKSDIQAAETIKMAGYLFQGGNLYEFVQGLNRVNQNL